MKALLVFAVMLMATIVVLTTGSPVGDSITQSQRRELHAVAQYRMFGFATVLYLKDNPGATGTLTWADIGPANSTPPSMRDAQMPPSFKAVVVSAKNYVICGELTEAAATALRQLMPEDVQLVAASGNKVVLTADSTTAEAEAAKCN